MSPFSECQEKFLSNLVTEQSIASIYLKNGIKLTGKIIASSKDAIFLNSPVPQMIYKNRVSTICFQEKTNTIK